MNIPVDSELTNAWRLVGTMSKIKDLLMEQEIEKKNINHITQLRESILKFVKEIKVSVQKILQE